MIELNQIKDHLTIGELSRMTGITTHTLRVWEKRYGAPIAIRLPSGHRRYRKDEVPRLRAIAKALDSGYRASKVVSNTLEELHTLLGLTPPGKVQESKSSPENIIQGWIEAIQVFEDEPLLNGFNSIWNTSGPLNFVIQYASEFIKRVEL